jgi:hypothetical protein
MPPRLLLPPDDLYARLELPIDASFEAIEIAWRALLKQHHPDVAGEHTDDLAKRINVAHDWLSDPALRDHYDRERHPGRRHHGGLRAGSRHRPRGASAESPVSAAEDARRPRAPRRRRAVDPAEAIGRFLRRVGRLTPDELDRLSLAESPPIAFVATIARFLTPDRLAAVEAVEARVRTVLPAAVWANPPIRDSIVGFAHELVLAPFLDEYLSDPFRDRVRERLARGWEAAADQPRYGPNTAEVGLALERLRGMPPGARAQLAVAAVTAARGTGQGVTADPPWPDGLSAEEDDALRVSSALAQRDALAILGDPVPALARRSLARAMHGLVLRHGFKNAELERLLGPWREVLVGPGPLRRPVARASRRAV